MTKTDDARLALLLRAAVCSFVATCGRASPAAELRPGHADDGGHGPRVTYDGGQGQRVTYDGGQGQRVADDGGRGSRPYGFRYAVHDPQTGDAKSHREAGDGLGAVRGEYSVVEPDGRTRVVEYSADDRSGFVARVKWIAPEHRATFDGPAVRHAERHEAFDGAPSSDAASSHAASSDAASSHAASSDAASSHAASSHAASSHAASSHAASSDAVSSHEASSAYEFDMVVGGNGLAPSVADPLTVHSYDV